MTEQTEFPKNLSNEAIQNEIDTQKGLSDEQNAVRYLEIRKELERANKDLDIARKEAETDPLTGLPNRNCLLKQMKTVEEILVRNNNKICVFFIDINNLKEINDRKGHKAGDEAIINVGKSLQANVRKSDIVAKGTVGDELIVVLTGTDEQGALTFYERLNKSMEANPNLVDVSISSGASTFEYNKNRPKKDFETILAEADKAMYKAKERKNDRQEKVGLIFYKEIINGQK